MGLCSHATEDASTRQMTLLRWPGTLWFGYLNRDTKPGSHSADQGISRKCHKTGLLDGKRTGYAQCRYGLLSTDQPTHPLVHLGIMYLLLVNAYLRELLWHSVRGLDFLCGLQLGKVLLPQVSQVWRLLNANFTAKLVDVLLQNVLPVYVDQWL